MTEATERTIKIHDLTPSITCSGANTDVYFDAENLEVYEFSTVGSGTPMLAYHGRHLHLGKVNSEIADDAAYREFVETVQEKLLEVANGLTVEWDGSNHVGRLADNAQELLNSIREEWSEIEVATFWDAAEWFAPVRGDVASEMTEEGFDLDAWTAEQVEYAKGEDAHLNADDVKVAALDILRDWVESNEDDEDEAELVERARAVLANA